MIQSLIYASLIAINGRIKGGGLLQLTTKKQRLMRLIKLMLHDLEKYEKNLILNDVPLSNEDKNTLLICYRKGAGCLKNNFKNIYTLHCLVFACLLD